jgi:hypothetical protein
MTEQAPLSESISATIPAATKEAVQDQVIGEAPFDGAVSSVLIVPEAALTAHSTNFRTFRVVNKGQGGAGTTVVATFATDTVTTDDLKAFDEKAIPLSGTAADLVVKAGDVLAADETKAAEGVAHSGYKVVVRIARS